MKTTKFFSEIKKVAKDSTLESMFDYAVNQNQNFYEIFLHSDPTAKVKTMCATTCASTWDSHSPKKK